MFQLTFDEAYNLKSQIVISRWGGRRHQPYAFTEQGVAMLSSVLRSNRAVAVNIAIMRAFVKLREFASLHKDIMNKLTDLENRVGKHDEAIKNIFQAIYELMSPPKNTPKRRIGFRAE